MSSTRRKRKKEIFWKTEKRWISDLKAHPDNPRTLSEKSYEELLKSFEEFDYVELVAINTDNTILAGHQRVLIMQELGWDEEIEVRVPSRKLNKKEAGKYLLRSNKNTGDWDYEIMANRWEIQELYDAGFTEQELIGKFPVEIEEPESFTAEDSSKLPSLKITFKKVEDLQHAENLIAEVVNRYDGAYYSVSAGEL